MPAIRGNDYAKGNPGGGAPEGNQNAVGSGAPKLNTNAAKHHGWSDPLKHYHRLTGDRKDGIDRFLSEYVEDYALVHGVDTETVEADEAVMDDLRRLAAMHDQWMCASVPFFKEGFIIEEEREYEDETGETRTYTTRKVNPAENACWRMTSKRRKLREKLGIDHPAVRKARSFQGALSDEAFALFQEWKRER